MFMDKSELNSLAKSGKILSKILNQIKMAITNGERDLNELDLLAKKLLLDYNSKSAFKDFQPDFATSPFEYYICASVNEELVHGLPTKGRILQDGDIVSIDLGLEHDGWFADSAFTIGIGEIKQNHKLLIEGTEKAFEAALQECIIGKKLGDLGHAVQETAAANKHAVALGLMGHGIGRSLHEKPDVLNFGRPNTGIDLFEGLSICIEPILIDGLYSIKELEDGWTLVTEDGSFAAHYEHTVAITKDGPLVLTRE
jgi:methionyl aminopeptidase